MKLSLWDNDRRRRDDYGGRNVKYHTSLIDKVNVEDIITIVWHGVTSQRIGSTRVRSVTESQLRIQDTPPVDYMVVYEATDYGIHH